MKRILVLLLLLSVVSFEADAQSRRKDRKVLFNSSYNYEIVPIEVGTEGTKYVKVWAYGKKVEDAINTAKMSAVAAAIFRGIPAGGDQVAATPPLCRDMDAAEKHEAYFEEFFTIGGPYLQFVTQTSHGVPSGQDQVKIKKGYKVGISVQIMYDNLRRKLEQDGIIRGLSSGF